ncbi:MULTISPECIES: hypothetical protein [Haloferacaceae]|uniref:Uncharacterized protein n=2 Tax=Haloferacaceae TaxID=1644056 RepID=A0ABD6DDC1_9EURY|nr:MULTISPECIES: hypothetical protein [Halorubraceae]
MELPITNDVEIIFTDGTSRDVLLTIQHRDSEFIYAPRLTGVNEETLAEDVTKEDIAEMDILPLVYQAAPSFRDSDVFDINEKLHAKHSVNTIDAHQFTSTDSCTIGHPEHDGLLSVSDRDINNIHPDPVGKGIAELLSGIADPANNHLSFSR